MNNKKIILFIFTVLSCMLADKILQNEEYYVYAPEKINQELTILEEPENLDNIIKENSKQRKLINKKIINISDYDYPLPETPEEIQKSGKYTIAIIGTNDIHGSAFPMDSKDMVNNKEYTTGGLEYMSSEIKAVIKDWKDRVLLLDAGDEFQGGLENTLSNGEIITGFLNNLQYDSAAFGNHEFDFGQDFLRERINKSSFPYLASNIFDNKGQNIDKIFKNTQQTKMFTIGAGEYQVNIGVIGLATLETPSTTTGNLTNINFKDYVPQIRKHSESLKKSGADAVILLSHVGLQCDFPDRYDLNIKKKQNSDITQCEDGVKGEIPSLIDELGAGYIDGIIGGHKHALNKIWIKDIPFVSSVHRGRYFNIMYLTFDVDTTTKSVLNLRNNDILLEGPVPVCQKVFSRSKTCELFSVNDDEGSLKYFSFHNQVIYKDYTLRPLFRKWWKKLEPYKIPFAKSEAFLINEKNGNFVLGNYFCDCIKEATSSDFSILNDGYFRSAWNPGNIDDYVFLSMFPFISSKIVSTKITGSDLKKILSLVQGYKNEFFLIGGMRNFFKKENKKQVLERVSFLDDSEIDDSKEYKWVSNDFLFVTMGDGFKNVRDFWKPVITEEGDRSILKKCLEKTKILDKKTSMSITRNVYDK